MSSYTDLGIYLKKLRLDKGEKMADMAEKLDVSTSFLSSVESGKKRLPSSMASKLMNLYTPEGEERDALIEAMATTCDKVDIPLYPDDVDRNKLALNFAAGISQLTDEQLKMIEEILGGKK